MAGVWLAPAALLSWLAAVSWLELQTETGRDCVYDCPAVPSELLAGW